MASNKLFLPLQICNELKRVGVAFLSISHTEYDPEVIEIMKLSALADVQRRYEAGESR